MDIKIIFLRQKPFFRWRNPKMSQFFVYSDFYRGKTTINMVRPLVWVRYKIRECIHCSNGETAQRVCVWKYVSYTERMPIYKRLCVGFLISKKTNESMCQTWSEKTDIFFRNRRLYVRVHIFFGRLRYIRAKNTCQSCEINNFIFISYW